MLILLSGSRTGRRPDVVQQERGSRGGGDMYHRSFSSSLSRWLPWSKGNAPHRHTSSMIPVAHTSELHQKEYSGHSQSHHFSLPYPPPPGHVVPLDLFPKFWKTIHHHRKHYTWDRKDACCAVWMHLLSAQAGRTSCRPIPVDYCCTISITAKPPPPHPPAPTSCPSLHRGM